MQIRSPCTLANLATSYSEARCCRRLAAKVLTVDEGQSVTVNQ